ncbi:MAG TPA: glycosyltransferase [Polyangiaceae bacterium]|nr:glycosyltransferase [Polyangiaceae bacterium]
MTRAVVVTLPERGHFHPLLGPALELERRGVEVTFATTADIRGDLAGAGISRIVVPPHAEPPSASLRGEALARILADAEALRGWIRFLLTELPSKWVPWMRAVLRELRPDVVAIDTMSYEGAIAAELEGIPWVGWSTSLNPVIPDDFDSELIRTIASLDNDRHALFRSHGLAARFRVSDVLSPAGTAAFTTDALVSHATDPDVVLAGPSLGGTRGGESLEPADRSNARPLVYVSFGSQAFHQPKRFEHVFAAAAHLDVDVLAAMGDLAAHYVRPHVRCVRFSDQLAALRAARIIVTHAGANSVMEGLAAGVPLLMDPICNDQPHNAAFVERAGAGMRANLEGGSVEDTIEAMQRLLADGSHRKNAARLATSYRSKNGAVGAAELALRACR